jgi:galactokinase
MRYLIAEKVVKEYYENFDNDPVVVRAPGRVNIIGEHTDYNEGYVLPASIDKATFVAVGKRTDNMIHLISNDYNEKFETSLSTMQPLKNWPTYILGVANQMIQRGYQLQGFNLVIQGDVPIGAGLSSSASVECATAFALNELFQLPIPALELIDIAQKAEHTFAGVMCGVMDQFYQYSWKKRSCNKIGLSLDGI